MRCAPALRNEGLPFADILTEASIRDVLNEHGVQYRDRVFSPVTTIWGFLSQVLSEDHSCRDAVSRIIAHRAANGLAVCSPNTASYCNARSRLLTSVLSTLARRTAEELQTSVARPMEVEWPIGVHRRWLDRLDAGHRRESSGCTHSRQIKSRGSAFRSPESRSLLSLATGACHDLAIAPYKGKGTGEKTLFRRMYDTLQTR